MLMHLGEYSEPPPGGHMRPFQVWIVFINMRTRALWPEPPPGGHKRAFQV